MDSKKRNLILGGAGGAVLVGLVVGWWIADSHAEEAATELVTATVDMARCVAGGKVKIDRASILQGFERRMVSEMPDVSTLGNCDLALAVVKRKWSAYKDTWLNDTGSTDDKGRPLGKRFQTALDELSALPLKTPSNKVYHWPKKYGKLLKAGELSFEMFDAAREILKKEGASEDAIRTAIQMAKREIRKTPARAPRGKKLVELKGSLAPDRWNIEPMTGKELTLTALTDQGQGLLAWSNDSGDGWQHVVGATGAGADSELRAIHAPGGKRFFSLASGKGKDTVLRVGAFPSSSGTTFPKSKTMPHPPENWSRAPGGEREVGILADGTAVLPIWKIVEKTKEEKKAEEKAKKEREKNYADKSVQAALVLENARAKKHEALGIDEDHKRLDGLQYVLPDGSSQVKELAGYGLGAIVPGIHPQLLLGEDEIPSLRMASVALPKSASEPLGPLSEAGAMKPVEPALRGSPWYRCTTTTGTTYGATQHGTMLIGLHPGALELVPMTALADEGSHMGCGPQTTLVALPFAKDRIFSNLLTIQAGEIEGGKITTTAGTRREEYNATVASAVVPGAIVVAWVARGYVLYAVSRNNGSQFFAPQFLAEAGTDGSMVRSVHLVDLGRRLIAVVAREKCQSKNQGCVTTLEALKSDDAAKTWQPL